MEELASEFFFQKILKYHLNLNTLNTQMLVVNQFPRYKETF